MWGRLRDALLNNLGLKLASLVLSLLLFAHVITDQQRESRIPVPIVLTGIADTLAVSGKIPPRVTVRVRGKWKDLIRLGIKSGELRVDLADAVPGRFHHSVSVEDVRERVIPAELSKTVEVVEVLEPRTLDLTIEPRKAKTVPVAARIVGIPSPGYAVQGAISVDPDTARVEGPASVLAALDTIYTLPVDIAGEREKIQRQVQLDAGTRLLAVEPRRCIVTLRIGKAAPESSAQHL